MEQHNYTIDGFDVLHIKNAFSEDVLRRWEDYYVDRPFYNIGGNFESNQVYFNSGIHLSDYINIFPVNDIINYIQQIAPQCDKSCYQKSYINAIKAHQTFTPHKDRYELGDNEFYTIALWFANPFWDTNDGGFTLGDNEQVYIPNTYNDLVVFPGDLLHNMESHTSKYTRITVYSAFSNQFNKLAGEIIKKNRW